MSLSWDAGDAKRERVKGEEKKSDGDGQLDMASRYIKETLNCTLWLIWFI